MKWLLIAVLAAGIAWWMWRARPVLADGPIPPAQTGTGDRTAQRPKARPWRG